MSCLIDCEPLLKYRRLIRWAVIHRPSRHSDPATQFADRQAKIGFFKSLAYRLYHFSSSPSRVREAPALPRRTLPADPSVASRAAPSRSPMGGREGRSLWPDCHPLQAAEALVISQTLELEKLRYEIARHKRMKFGRSSEQPDHQLTQMQLALEDLESSLAQQPEAVRRRRTEVHVRRPSETCAGTGASRPVARSLAGLGFLAHVLVAKHADRLPLLRRARFTLAEACSSIVPRFPTGCA
jgi:transposase IS166 family protein